MSLLITLGVSSGGRGAASQLPAAASEKASSRRPGPSHAAALQPRTLARAGVIAEKAESRAMSYW